MNRQQALIDWLTGVLGENNVRLDSMTGDAGFRQYYRTTLHGQSVIVVDAPNDKSNNQAFIALQQSFSEQGIQVPDIIAVNLEHGFFCLSDLGTTLLSDRLTALTMKKEYQSAIDLLPLISQTSTCNDYQLPLFDRNFIQTELDIFNDWLLTEFLKLEYQIDKLKMQQCFEVLIENALEQPQVVMHRDFHSRNIMVLENNEFAIIDFQDAVIGPLTYDAVSLLRDCYVKWPQASVNELFEVCIAQYSQISTALKYVNREQFQRWFDLTGLQRHVKVAGIFPRLSLRDGKHSYLNDTPLVLEYIIEVSANYPELSYLHDITKNIVQPAFVKKIEGNLQ